MKIFFRYLFIRLLVPFMVTLFACTVIWIMVDLYGNISDFVEHKINIGLILRYYALAIPSMLVVVLPAAILFSSLWTLLSLNRRSELVAFQSGGMAPMWIFSPFILFTVIWVGVLAYDMSGPAAQSQVTRDRLLAQVKGLDAGRNVFLNLPYVDNINRRVWFFQRLDTNQGTAKGVEILQRDAHGHDMWKDFAREARWSDGFWKLSGVLEITFSPDGSEQGQKTYEEKDLDITTPPTQFSLIVSQPEQLTLTQLAQYIATSTSSKLNLAKYHTEWWYRVIHPLSLLVLLIYALLQGSRSVGRRSAVAGVVWAIIVLFFYMIALNFFMAAGKYNRLPPFISVAATPVIFGLIGLHLMAVSNGWWWQLQQLWMQWRAKAAAKNAAAQDAVA